MFQLPMLPEIMMRCSDMQFLQDAFTDKGMGAKRGTFTEDDIEAYKYTFRNYGEMIQ